jgi:phosphoglycerate dehydrogenase-like enzyme
VQIGILEPDGFSPKARSRLAAIGSVAAHDGNDLARFLSDKDALFVRLAHRIDSAFISQAPRLTALCSPTTGLTHIDLDALSARGIVLLSLKGETNFLGQIRATPEHALGLTIALLRNYRTAFLDETNAHWDRDRCRGEELYGAAVGIIGFGRVGRRVATYLAALDAKVGWHDPHVMSADAGLGFGTVDELIAASQVIILAASHEPGAPFILGRQQIDALRGKYLINIARGELIDEDALLEAIEDGQLAGCAVDVISNELGSNRRTRWLAATRRRNVIVTPHIGGATFTSMQATEEFLAERLIAFCALGAARRAPA